MAWVICAIPERKRLFARGWHLNRISINKALNLQKNALSVIWCNARVPALQKMPQLETLRIGDPAWTSGPNSFQEVFKRALPKVDINFQEIMRELPMREPGT